MNDNVRENLGVVICGTNYGANYLELFRKQNRLFQLVAILSRGSDRSRQLARHHGVPFCNSVAEVPRSATLAVVAVPSSASHNLTLEFLDRGVSVIREHPVTTPEIREACRVAAKRSVKFHVNSHFSDLPAAIHFRRHLHQCRQQQEVLRFMLVTCSERSLFPTMELIGRVFGNVRPFTVHKSLQTAVLKPTNHDDSSVSYRDAIATIVDVPAHIAVSLKNREAANGSDAPLVCTLAVGLSSGTLTLCNPFGPVLWSSTFSQAAERPDNPMWSCAPAAPVTMREFAKERFAANLLSLVRLKNDLASGCLHEFQEEEYLVSIADLWSDLTIS